MTLDTNTTKSQGVYEPGDDELVDLDELIEVHDECISQGTFQQLFTLVRDTDNRQRKFEKEMLKRLEERDESIKEAFIDVKDTIKSLIYELDKRKVINNYTEKERQLIHDLLRQQEECDSTLFQDIMDIRKEQAKMSSDIAIIMKSVQRWERNSERVDERRWSLREKLKTGVIIAIVSGAVSYIVTHL